jgi:amino acid transporter
VIGTVIGSGIFLVPGGVLRQAGGQAGPALVVWVVGGALSLLGALAYGELGAMNPAAGGLYVYLRDAFGPLTAFLYGWTFFLVIQTGTIAAVAVAFARFTAVFWTHTPPRVGSIRPQTSPARFPHPQDFVGRPASRVRPPLRAGSFSCSQICRGVLPRTSTFAARLAPASLARITRLTHSRTTSPWLSATRAAAPKVFFNV